MASLDEAVEAKFGKKDTTFKFNKESSAKHIIAITSGKGGVGKSMVTSILAVSLFKCGFRVGILDADITGPSIPKAFDIKSGVNGPNKELMYPNLSKNGIKVMSLNLMMEDPTKPVLWMGPMIGSCLKQFYENTIWGDLDFLLIDMPPGTGDVGINVFKNMHVDGTIIVSTPQDLVKMIVGKAVNMCKQMNVPIIGLVENMSFMEFGGSRISPFGESKLNEVSSFYEISPLDALPINPDINKLVDLGDIESIDTEFFDTTLDKILKYYNM